MSYIDSNNITGLYPAEFKPNGTFCAKSSNIKVFPSSWRGAKLHRTTIDGKTEILPEASVTQFNPESALNTEYNITLPAGGIKTYIDQAYSEQYNDTTLYNFKFFINGYAFEVYNLDLRCYTNGEYTVPENLYANIRVGDMAVGSADIDFTKVLMPYNWTAIDTPIPLDASLEDAYLIDQVAITSWSELESKLPAGGVNWDDVGKDKDTYIFTGLVFSTSKLASSNSDTNSTYYSIQLVKNKEICLDKYWPKALSAGDTPTALATKIGQELIADTDYMLAVGRFNSTIKSTTEIPLLIVGNGTSGDLRRNAFEVSGSTSPDKVAIKQDGSEIAVFTQQIKAGPFEVKYNSDLQAKDKAAQVQGVYTINDNIEIDKDGSYLIINKPNEEGAVISNADIGLKTYGNVKLVGDGTAIHFIDWGTFNKETQQFEEDDNSRIVSSIFVTTGTSTDGNNIKSETARGLHISNLYEVNQEALLFNPNNLASNKGKLRAINKNILIDRLHDHSIEVGQSGVCIYKDNNTKGIDNLNKLNQVSVTNDGKFTGPNGSSINLSAEKDVKINNTSLLDLMYPIGSIYMTMSAQHPSLTFAAIGGGKWKQISRGRMLLGVDPDSSKEEFKTAGNVGAELAYVPPHTHGLTVANSGTQQTSITLETNENDDYPHVSDGQLGLFKAHTHTVQASSDSKHHHSIPVSFPGHLWEAANKMYNEQKGGYYAPHNFGGYPTGTDLTKLGWNADEQFRANTDAQPENALQNYKYYVRPGDNSKDPHKTWAHWIYNKEYWSENNGYNGNTWKSYDSAYDGQVEPSNLFSDKGQILIPTVAMGTWFTPKPISEGSYVYHSMLMQWNKPSVVKTGYQSLGNKITSKIWGHTYDTDTYAKWAAAYEAEWGWFRDMYVKVTKNTFGATPYYSNANDDYKLLLRSMPSSSQELLYEGTLLVWADYNGNDEDFGPNTLYNDGYKLNFDVLKYDGTYTEEDGTVVVIKADDADINARYKWVFGQLKTKVGPATVSLLLGKYSEFCTGGWKDSWLDNIDYKNLPSPWLHDIKACFTQDFFNNYVRDIDNADSDKPETSFKALKPDGEHTHILDNSDIAVHKFALERALKHTHTVEITNENFNLQQAGNQDYNNIGRPPYLTCYIWQRMSDNWEDDGTNDAFKYEPNSGGSSGSVTPLPGTGGGIPGYNPGIQV